VDSHALELAKERMFPSEREAAEWYLRWRWALPRNFYRQDSTYGQSSDNPASAEVNRKIHSVLNSFYDPPKSATMGAKMRVRPFSP